MRIILDAREAVSSRPTGKGQWARRFLGELVGRAEGVTLLSDRQVPGSLGTIPTVRVENLGSWLWHLRARKALMRLEGDLYFSPTSFIVAALGSAKKTAILVHDLIAFRREPHQRKAKFIEHLTLRRALRNAACVFTVSEATKQDLLEHFPSVEPQNVTVLGAGPFQDAASLAQPDEKTILSIGTLCPRKNQERLILAYRSLPEELRLRFRLVIAGGRGWQDESIIRLGTTTPGVTLTGYVDDTEYERLLGSATVFAFPSLYEGFGMPVLDALQRGVPVLTSDRGSLREVAGTGALYVDPENIASITAGLQRLLTDADLRSQLRVAGPAQARQWSWAAVVDRFLTAARAACGGV